MESTVTDNTKVNASLLELNAKLTTELEAANRRVAEYERMVTAAINIEYGGPYRVNHQISSIFRCTVGGYLLALGGDLPNATKHDTALQAYAALASAGCDDAEGA